jgi:hypothetical protein
LREYIGRELGGIPFNRIRESEFTTAGLSRRELHDIVVRLREMVPTVIGQLQTDSLHEVQPLKLSGTRHFSTCCSCTVT